jgi:signal transduction histidine kinase
MSSFIMMNLEARRDILPSMSSDTRQQAVRWAEWIIVSLLLGSALYEIWVIPGGTWPGSPLLNSALAAVIILPVLFRRRFPLGVLLLVLVGSGVQYVYGGDAFQPWFAFVLAFYAVAAYSGRRRAVLGGIIGALPVVAVSVAKLLGGDAFGEVVPPWFFVAGVWAFGRWMRSRGFQTRQLEDRAARLEVEREEKARAAVAAERARIARELHDVVAHSVSVMVVQAQAAQRLTGAEQTEFRQQTLNAIETTGRQALVEMRRLLGVLRHTDADLSLAPQPGLGDIDELISQVREADLPVELRIEGEAWPLPPGVDLSAYRIVQEALTNTLKHAGPARARVTIRYGNDDVELEIADDGPGTGPGGGSGQGLIGMRERVALYGGAFENGKHNGGYRVRARLPLDADRT